LFEQGVDRPAL